MTDLDDHLTEGLPDTEEQRAVWRIDGNKTAGWAMRKLARLLQDQDRIRRDAGDRIEQIEAWRQHEIDKLDHDVDFFMGHLRRYREHLEDIDPACPKTYSLPEGKLARRKMPDSVEVNDTDIFVTWCDVNDATDLYTAQPRPAKDEIKRAIGTRLQLVEAPDGDVAVVVDASTGEAVPGVVVRIGGTRIDVKPDLGGAA